MGNSFPPRTALADLVEVARALIARHDLLGSQDLAFLIARLDRGDWISSDVAIVEHWRDRLSKGRLL